MLFSLLISCLTLLYLNFLIIYLFKKSNSRLYPDNENSNKIDTYRNKDGYLKTNKK